MTRRSPVIRLLALLWATLQIASPGLGALADGLLAAQTRDPASHVEATTSGRCPVVHAPDCGLCRQLTTAVAVPPRFALELPIVAAAGVAIVATGEPPRAVVPHRWGRAPPLA